MTFFAHSLDGQDIWAWERLEDHLIAVSQTAGRYAADFEAGPVAEIAGWLHDLGKVKPAFQAKLRGVQNNVSHSGEGARYARENFGLIGKLIAFCIAGHHSGLPNGIDRSAGNPATPLAERLNQAETVDLPPDVTLPLPTMPGPLAESSAKALFEIQFFTRMLFSALVDADFIETERFYSPAAPRGARTDLDTLRVALTRHLEKFDRPETAVNRMRAEVLEAAGQAAYQSPGLFTLTVPTGGGKTLTSLRFALDHALAHGLQRVIYVAPFTAIIEQTAEVFRDALDDLDAVLEHHSSFDVEDAFVDETQAERLKLAAQNWDRPVVVTTAVQFFESLFANRTQKCRKLHNIARTVVVLDEAQALPVNYLRPCLAALKELVRGYGCSVVLCTATQPAIRDDDGLRADEAIPAKATREIIPDPPELYRRLKRVEARFSGPLGNNDLASQVAGRKALVIVNNKRQARAIYDLLGRGNALHLSTNMTAAHRRDVLANICDGFDGPVISTALVEAGVDLDFPEVWRAVAGLDSIVQAAGRCNREGKQVQLGKVHVFEPEEGFPPPPELQQNAQIARDILRAHADDPLAPEAVRAYFRRLYWDRDADLDSRGIMRRIKGTGNRLDFPFADIAHDFRLIEEVTRPLIIGAGPYGIDDAARRMLEHGKYPGSIARAMQRYTVSVSPRVRDELVRASAAHVVRRDEFEDQFVVLDNARLYDDAAGFSAENPEDLGVMIA
ncbi:MAG: subtype I-C CRISPR-associated bifunctional helicase/endonuclease Cas3 [Rhodobacteraceae bacterium HLUCCA12]|nr:MAG: subtype I-C CRISPR-associated bifunctional helicase/endonuclease Cas3 [Rhodobacteraceae bacterium HLUCCA12]